MPGHIVAVRFFAGYTSSFPYDAFDGLRDEEVEGAAEALRQKWWNDSDNRRRFNALWNSIDRGPLDTSRLRELLKIPVFEQTTQRCPLPATTAAWGKERPPDFLAIATAAGWRFVAVGDFLPYCISDRYPLVRFDDRQDADDAVSALHARIVEVDRAAEAQMGPYKAGVLLCASNPRFTVVGEAELSRPDLARAREQILRLRRPVQGIPTETERCMRTCWSVLEPTLEQIEVVCASKARSRTTFQTSNPPPASAFVPPMPNSPFMAAADLAQYLGVGINKIDVALRRFLKNNPSCRQEVKDRRKGEPQYLYRVPQVWSMLVEKLPGWRAPSRTTD